MKLAAFQNVRIGAATRGSDVIHTTETAKPVLVEAIKTMLTMGHAVKVDERGYTTLPARGDFGGVVETVSIESVTFTPWSHGNQHYLQGFFPFEIEEPTA